MSELSSNCMEFFSQATMKLYGIETAEEFADYVDATFRILLPERHICVVDWIDPRNSASYHCLYFPENAVSAELHGKLHFLLPLQAPNWLQFAETPQSVSDLLTQEAWKERELSHALQEAGAEDFINLEILLSPEVALVILVLGARFGQFSTEDKFMLELLQPHFRQVYQRLLLRHKSLQSSGGQPSPRSTE